MNALIIPISHAGADRDRLDHDVEQRHLDAIPTNTKKAYASAWRRWTTWCEEQEEPTMPTTAPTLCRWAETLAQDGQKPATITARLAGVRWHHCEAGADDSAFEDVRLTRQKQAIRRTLGVAPKKAPPLTLRELGLLIDATEQSGDQATYERALLLLTYFGARRIDEVCRLTLGSVTVADTGAVELYVARSKKDQEGQGMQVAIAPLGVSWLAEADNALDLDPGRALTTWLLSRGDVPGFVFPSRTEGGALQGQRGYHFDRPLSGSAALNVVKKLGTRAGLEGMTTHSLRAGMITEATRLGISEAAIMRRSGHRSLSVFRAYNRPKDEQEWNR